MRTDIEKLADAALSPEEKRIRRIKEAGLIRTPDGSSRMAVARLRTAIAELTDANMPKIQSWLNMVSYDDPKSALDFVLRLLEFSVPKLSRVEAEIKLPDGSSGLHEITIGDLEGIVRRARDIEGAATVIPEEFADLI